MKIQFLRDLFHKFVDWVKSAFTNSIALKKPDAETQSLLNDPEFRSILEQAKAQKASGGFSEAEMKQWLLESKSQPTEH